MTAHRTFRLMAAAAFFAGSLSSMVLGAGCTAMTRARPLAPGQHAVSVVGGGPITQIPGIGKIPLPNVTVEGRHGLVHHLDVGYGVHLLPLVFGVAGVHGGAAYQLFDQPAPWVPALTVTQDLFAFSNLIDPRKARRDFFALSQTSLIASWSAFDQLAYVGLAGDVPLTDPQVFLSPFAGVELRPGIDWLRLQAEARWLAPAVNQRYAVVQWIGPEDQGAIQVKLALAVVFGGAS